MKSKPYAFLAATSLITLAQPAFAQTAPAASDPAESAGLADIVVTATRSGETNLQDTPVAITALNSQALTDRGVTSVRDLNALAPNVSIGGRSGAGGLAGTVTIRGIGIDANPPASPAVGIYVDDVYMPSSYGNLIGLFDVARVEVLRGPQGTLFGRNTISGAIQYVSNKPILGEFSGFGEATGGNQGRYDFSAGINIPLGDIAALRVSGALTHRDGYVRSILKNTYLGSEDSAQGRVQLRVRPASNVTIDLKYEQLTQRSNGPASIQTGFNYATVFGGPFAAMQGLDPFISPDFYTTAGQDGLSNFRSKLQLGQGVIAWEVSDGLTIKSITAYSRSEAKLDADQDGTPIPIINVSRGLDINKLFTQELQLSGKLAGGRLHYTLGAYYYDEETSNSNALASIFGGPPTSVFGDYVIKIRSYAVYGQATFDITDQLSVVGGLRYTSDKVTGTDAGFLNPTLNPFGRNFKNTSPLVGVNFRANEDVLIYAKWSRGFRAGGFSPNIGGPFSFGPETAETFEVGTRMEFLDRRLRINPTVFQTDWSNIQFNQIALVTGLPFPLPIIGNAGDARLKGGEVEIQALVTTGFTVSASAALLDAKYTRIDPSLTGKVTFASDLKRAPKSSFTLGARYEHPVGDGRVALSANYAWQAYQRSSTTDLDTVPIPAYGLLAARLEYRARNDRFSVAVFGTNLTNQKYVVGGTNYGNGGTIPTTQVDVGRPREFGITTRFNF